MVSFCKYGNELHTTTNSGELVAKIRLNWVLERQGRGGEGLCVVL